MADPDTRKVKQTVGVRPMRGGFQIQSDDIPGLDILVADAANVPEAIRAAAQRSMKRHHEIDVHPVVAAPVLDTDMTDPLDIIVMFRVPKHLVEGGDEPPPRLATA